MCMILVLLFLGGCMSYDICSVFFLVLCTIRLIHVVPMMLYQLDYCELLSLFLAGITVCSCNRILQICVYKLIGGDEL